MGLRYSKAAKNSVVPSDDASIADYIDDRKSSSSANTPNSATASIIAAQFRGSQHDDSSTANKSTPLAKSENAKRSTLVSRQSTDNSRVGDSFSAATDASISTEFDSGQSKKSRPPPTKMSESDMNEREQQEAHSNETEIIVDIDDDDPLSDLDDFIPGATRNPIIRVTSSSAPSPGSLASPGILQKVSAFVLAKLSVKAKMHMESFRGISGYKVPTSVLKTYFEEYCVDGLTGTKVINQEDFFVICGLLELEHTDEDIQHIYQVVVGSDTGMMDMQGCMKAIQRGDFLKNVVTNNKAIEPYAVPESFDWCKSTNDNYNSPGSEFVGQFVDIRKKMDYSYHATYPPERQLWQDQIIQSIVVRTKTQTQPWIVYTCGPMGAGKGYALSWMSSHGVFPLEGIVHIDPDQFKASMTEWDGYVQRSKGDSSIQPGTLCHRESGFMQEIAQQVALEAKQNIWVDGSLKDGAWFSKVFTSLRKQHPQYRIGIFYVYASESVIRERIKSREEQTGRGVPESELRASLDAPDKSLGILMPLVDFVARINNEGGEPILDAFETVDRSGAWMNIASRFARTQPAISDFPQRLAPLYIQRVDNMPYDVFNLSEDDIQKLSNFSGTDGISITVRGDVLSKKAMEKRSSVKYGDMNVMFSPTFPVSGDNETKRLALVPGPAFSFVFCYSVSNFETMNGADRIKKDVQTFFKNGGFVYFDLNNKICGVNAIQDPSRPTAHMIHFGPSTVLDADQSAVMREKHKGHYHKITLQFMLDTGATHYAWVPPGQTFGSGIQNYLGGFSYIFEEFPHKDRIFPIIPG